MNIFNKQIDILLDKYLDFGNIQSTYRQNILLKTISSSKYTKTDIDLSIISTHNPKENNSSNDIIYSVNLFNNQIKQTTQLSGQITYLDINQTPYLKINKFEVFMGKGNSEEDFLKTLLGGIIDKRIMLDTSKDNSLIGEYYNINTIFSNTIDIRKCDIFYKQKQTTHKGKIAYKLGLDKNKIGKCFNTKNIDYEGIVFDGFLIPISEKEAILDIRKLQIPQNKEVLIDMEINNKTATINIHDFVNKESVSINIQYSKNKDIINIKSKKYNFKMQTNRIKDKLNFVGNIEFIYINRDNIKFDFKGNITLPEESHLQITHPLNYIIMSQLLGDDFYLKNLIGQ